VRLGWRPFRDERDSDHAALLVHLDAAYNYARYLTRDVHGADDVVQSAFVRAIAAAGSRRGDAKPWLLSIVRNCFHDWLSMQRRETALEQEPGVAGVDDNAIDVRKAVAALAPPFREVIVLREFEGLSYAEIADICQIPAGTVMSRLARARRELGEMLGETAA
jgi:RNA polymerase sigma factor (sigma-70 family)